MILKKYNGTAIHSSLGERGRSSGEISFYNGSFVFTNETIRKNYNISGLKIEMQKMGIPLYYFSHSMEPAWTFYTSDKSILKDKNLVENESIKKIKANKLKSRIIRSFTTLFVVVSIASLFIFGGNFKKNIVSKISNKVPVTWEIEIGELVYSGYASEVDIIKDPKLDKIVEELTKPLISKIEDKRYPFKIHVARDEEINAFAIMGGHMVINSSMIEFANSPEEILGVLAHEIAHVQKRHSVSQIINSLGIYSIIQFLFGDMTGVAAVFLDNTSFIINQSFSREFELEADLIGLHYLTQANINPNGIVGFFENIQKKETEIKNGNADSKIDESIQEIEKIERSLEFLSSHPDTQNRIKIIKDEINKLPADKKNQKMIFDLNKLKNLIKNR